MHHILAKVSVLSDTQSLFYEFELIFDIIHSVLSVMKVRFSCITNKDEGIPHQLSDIITEIIVFFIYVWYITHILDMI